MRSHFEPSVSNPLVSFKLGVPVGASIEPEGYEGLSHHTAELARRGAGSLDRTALDDAIDGLGATVDIDVGRDTLVLSATCLVRNLDRTVELASMVLGRPAMAKSEHELLARETKHDLDSLRDDDGTLVERHFQRLCSPGHSYGRTTIGTDQSIDRFTADRASAHFRALWRHGEPVFGLTGPVSPQRADEVRATLGNALIGPGGLACPDLVAPPLPSGRRIYLIDKPSRSQCQMMIGHLAPRYGTDDFVALMAVETAFGGMFSSRLMQEVRVKRGWSYGASCRMMRSRGSHFFRISLAPTREVAADALALVLELYDQLSQDGLRQDELDLAVQHLTGGLPFARATPRQRVNQAVRHELLGLDPSYPQTLGDRLSALTLDDVRGACARWLTPQNLCVTLVATEADLAPDLARHHFALTEVIPWDSY